MTFTSNRIGKNACEARPGPLRGEKKPRQGAKHGRKTVIVPFDFSPASEHALDHAIRQARKSGDEIRIVHVLSRPYGYGLLERRNQKDWQTGAHKDAEARLHKILAAKNRADLPIATEIRTGLPEYEILKAAEAASAGLIVMGRASRSSLSRLISAA